MSSLFTAKGLTGQVILQMGSFMHMSEATLEPSGYDSVKKKPNKTQESSCEGGYFIGMSLARKTIL